MNQIKSETHTSARIDLGVMIGLIAILILSCSPMAQTLTPQSTQVETEYVGRVINSATQQPIRNAKVSLDLRNVPSIAYTDSEGIYRFRLPINSDTSGTIRVDAQGYETYTRNIRISPDETALEDIRLIPPATTPPAEPKPTEISTLQWCDNFDNGYIDQTKWNLPTDTSIIFEENGALNFRVIEEQSLNGGAWAGIEAKLTDNLIAEISFTISLASYGENIPGGVGIDAFLKEAEPVFSVDIGPGPDGPGAEFSFCPDFNAGYNECRHPTPVPDKTAFPVVAGTPIDIRVVGTGKDIIFNIGNQPLAGQPVTASIENFQFFIYADSGSTLHVTIDNACVTYMSN